MNLINHTVSNVSNTIPAAGYWVTHSARIQKAMEKHLGLVKRILLAHRQNLNWDVFETNAKREFETLLLSLPLHPGSPRHLFNQLMPTLAAMGATFRVLRALGYTANQIGRIYYEGYLYDFSRIPSALRWVAAKLMVSKLFVGQMNKVCSAMTKSGRTDTFFLEYQFTRRPCRATRMRCTQCAMITFMEQNDLEEMKAICNVFDFAQARAFGLGLIQPSRLGAGDADCRYIFTSNPQDTTIPPQVKTILETRLDTEPQLCFGTCGTWRNTTGGPWRAR